MKPQWKAVAAKPPRLHGAWHFVLATLTLALTSLGCSQEGRRLEMAPVEGAVTLDGKPLQDGVVNLESAKTGFAANASLDANGHFLIAKIPVGTYSVTVSPPAPPDPGEPAPLRPASLGPFRPVPEKYWNAATSDLTTQVESGDATPLQIELTR
ncbi:MAG: carboxypeptidase-like regulatory domain-containing protein [Blastopirellula sp. JB062]